MSEVNTSHTNLNSNTTDLVHLNRSTDELNVQRQPLTKDRRKHSTYEIKHEPCKNIPNPLPGITWPEVANLDDPEVRDVIDLANASKSRAWIEGNRDVNVGDEVRVKIELYNGRGERKTVGGDLVSHTSFVCCCCRFCRMFPNL